jgi:hypothetical protein
MNDPHVVSLTYRLEVGKRLTFNSPPPLEQETVHFAIRLENGTLVVSMTEHHPTVESAQERVAPFLRSWELDNELKYGPNAMRFAYQTAEVIDRNPPPLGSPHTIQLEQLVEIETVFPVEVGVGRDTYPPPPCDFVASPDVTTLWTRFQGYREGREPLSGMAYFCLTVLEARGRGRSGAAKVYQVHPKVLGTLGKLTSDRGDGTTGRKFLPTARPLSDQEAAWVEEVVRVLIRRAGEHAAGAPLRRITMGDFRPC